MNIWVYLLIVVEVTAMLLMVWWVHHFKRKHLTCPDCGALLHRDIRKTPKEQRQEPIGHTFVAHCTGCEAGFSVERVKKKRNGGEKLRDWLLARLPHKEMGWKEIGERFVRFRLIKTRWFNVYLHWLEAPTWHTHCHDHPWHFWAVLLWGGYLEELDSGKKVWRGPGSVLYRHARFRHNVITPRGPNWSIIVTSGVKRKWGFVGCKP